MTDVTHSDGASSVQDELAHAAWGYAQRGWRVLPVHWIKEDGRCSCSNVPWMPPCASAGKHPVENGWTTGASTVPQIIAQWWGAEYPRSNVGVATGRESDVWVLDVDEGVRTDGTYKQGLDSLVRMTQEHGELPETFTVRTGGGGTQYFFTYPEGFEIKSDAGGLPQYPDIDIRGKGGMVVVPPSVSSKGPYTVESDHPTVPAPDWLVEILMGTELAYPTDDVIGSQNGKVEEHVPRTVTVSDAPHWFAIGMEEKIRTVREAPNGQGNNTINRVSYMIGQYIPHGWISFEDAQERLTEAVAGWVHPHPMAAYTIRRALTNGSKHPYVTTATQALTGVSARFFDRGGLLVRELAEDVLSSTPAALTAEEGVALYADGVYQRSSLALMSALEERLENKYRPAHMAAVQDVIKARLYRAGLRLPDRTPEPIVNLRNGMLDLRTGHLLPWDPAYMSSSQLPVEWDEHAECPTYEAWLQQVCPAQADDLEETLSAMLNPSRTPLKHAFLYGPSRSGKSTIIRIAEAIAGRENSSGVTLVQITGNRFMAANVYGKILNAAADISSGHLEDVSLFKQLTGDDTFTADRKHGRQFEFHSKALFLFSANELPSVGENSGAYVERIKPFEFGHSFAGREQPGIEERILRDELPGVLRRWVEAWQRKEERGGYAPTVKAVQEEFEMRSDRVRQWLSTCMALVAPRAVLDAPGCSELPPGCFEDEGPEGTARTMLYALFLTWAKESGGAKLGRNKFYDRLNSMNDVFEVRVGEARTRGYNIIPATDDA